jgi:hypothetical protein
MRARMWGVRMGDVELEHANFLESERVYGLSANIIFCPTNLPTLSLTDVRVTAVTGLTARPSCIRPSLQPRFFFNPEIAQIMPNGAYMELFSFTHPRIVPSTHKPIPRSPPPPTMGKQSLWLCRLRIYRRPAITTAPLAFEFLRFKQRLRLRVVVCCYEAGVMGGHKWSTVGFEFRWEVTPLRGARN